MKKNILLLPALCVSLALTACGKDEGNNDCDNSGNRTSEEWILAPTDLEYMHLFGKVKSYTMSSWEDCKWENNEIVPGYVDSKDEYAFNEAGYIISYKEYSYSYSENELYLRSTDNYTYDTRNRVVLKEHLWYSGIKYKYEYIYDDDNKTVLFNVYDYNDEWILINSIQYKQNKYGRIDNDNYIVKELETRSRQIVTKYDAYGNQIESYYILADGSVSYFWAAIYEYYE